MFELARDAQTKLRARESVDLEPETIVNVQQWGGNRTPNTRQQFHGINLPTPKTRARQLRSQIDRARGDC